jgi:hypothetical protein
MLVSDGNDMAQQEHAEQISRNMPGKQLLSMM